MSVAKRLIEEELELNTEEAEEPQVMQVRVGAKLELITDNPDEGVEAVTLDEFQTQLFDEWLVRLDANDSSAHRQNRLKAVKGAIIKYGLTAAYKIAALNDHKGMLCITWAIEPTQQEKALLAHIWNLCGGEPHDCVQHAPDSMADEPKVDFGKFRVWRAYS